MFSRAYGLGVLGTGTLALVEAFQTLGYRAKHCPEDFTDLLGYQAAAEGAVLNHWKALAGLYPDAKFVLTLATSLEAWVESSHRILESNPLDKLFNTRFETVEIRNRMYRYGVTEFDEEKLRQHYMRHVHSVAKFFSGTDRLYVMIEGKGEEWEGLCNFLEAPVPDFDYPDIVDC